MKNNTSGWLKRILSGATLFALAAILLISILLLVLMIFKHSDYGLSRYENVWLAALLLSCTALIFTVQNKSRSKLLIGFAAVFIFNIGIFLGCIVDNEPATKTAVTWTLSMLLAYFFPKIYEALQGVKIALSAAAVTIIASVVSGAVTVAMLLLAAGSSDGVSPLNLTEPLKIIAIIHTAVILDNRTLEDDQKLRHIIFYLLLNSVLFLVMGETGNLIVIALVTILLVFVDQGISMRVMLVFAAVAAFVVLIFLASKHQYSRLEAANGAELSSLETTLGNLYSRISKRILLWWDPKSLSSDVAFQSIRASEAITLGGLFGSSYKLYVPAERTDYIFTMVILKMGLVTAAAVLGCFLTMLIEGTKTSLRIENKDGRLVSLGFIYAITISSLIMILGSTGAIPVTGICIAFLSGGGMNALVTSLMVGFVLFYRIDE